MSDDNRRVHCERHGLRRPAFVCRHLVSGAGLGFVEPCGEQDPDASDEQAAWCDRCEATRLASGGWTPASEAAAGISLICGDCFDAARARNSRWTAVSRRWGYS